MEKLTKIEGDERRDLRELFSDADEVWRNDLYLVGVWKAGGNYEGRTLVRLSIRRHDRKPISEWSDKQEIKNQVIGQNCEGVELYPAECRKHDQVNQYHLWVVADDKFRFPFGWTGCATLHGDEKNRN